MKWLFAMIFVTSTLWARPVVLVSYYDTFGKASFNNSERVARRLEARINQSQKAFTISLCPLQTIFDVAYGQLETCLKRLPESPVMVLGLGESNCNFKIETIMRNFDSTKAPDNAGNERKNQVIIPEASSALGLKYPLSSMYCAVDSKVRSEMEVSNNAGSFVCNNTAFQMSYYYPEIQLGFIHVPASQCRNLEPKTAAAVDNLEIMLIAGVDFLSRNSNPNRLPTTKKELETIRARSQTLDRCQQELVKRTRGVDETGIWNIFRRSEF